MVLLCLVECGLSCVGEGHMNIMPKTHHMVVQHHNKEFLGNAHFCKLGLFKPGLCGCHCAATEALAMGILNAPVAPPVAS